MLWEQAYLPRGGHEATITNAAEWAKVKQEKQHKEPTIDHREPAGGIPSRGGW
jgi:hypothetical protein